MKQKTAKTALDALKWIANTPHHWASAEEKGFFVVGNREEKLRIPVAVLATMEGLYETAHELDMRMYRPTGLGRAMLDLVKAGVWIDFDAKTGGRYVFVTGPAGTGKTRFIRGEIARLEAAGVHCVHWEAGARIDDPSDRRTLRQVGEDGSIGRIYIEQTRG